MGQGDKKEPYQPFRKSVRCDVTGKMFSSISVRRCHDEAVISRYGLNGEANVCYYVCVKCRHAVHYDFHGGLGCELDGKL